MFTSKPRQSTLEHCSLILSRAGLECTSTPANNILTPDRDYIQIRSPVYIPHSAGRYASKRFRKANCPIIERLTNSLMMHGRNNGKKLMAVRIVAHAFEIVRAPNKSNPRPTASVC